MLGNGLGNLLVDGEESLASSPVHLADELATEGVDDARYGRSGALADEVKVKHALDGAGLEAVHEASRLVVEKSVRGKRAQRPAGGREATNVVVSRQRRRLGAARCGSGGHGCKSKRRRLSKKEKTGELV